MRSDRFLIGSVALAVIVLFFTGCGNKRGMTNDLSYMPTPEEEFYGAWTYGDATKVTEGHQRLIHRPWGLVEVYTRVEDKLPEARGTFALVRKWSDKKGDLWYISLERYEMYPNSVRYTLARISNNGKKYEEISDVFAVPRESEMKPTNNTYGEWHRSQ